MPDVELFAIRIGCLLVLDKVYTEGHQAGPEDQQRARQISQEIMRRIRESPIVVEEPKEDLGPTGHWSDVTVFGQEPPKRAALEFGDRVVFKAHWPRKNQELFHHSGPCLEDFTLTYNGAIYATTVQCDKPIDPSYSFLFGREGHRILKAILAPSDQWDLEVVGPSPMGPVFYIAFADDPSEYSFGRELIREGDTSESLLVMPRPAVANPIEAVGDVLEELFFPADMYYAAMIARLGFYHELESLYSSFDNATKLYRGTLDPLPPDPRRWLSRVASSRKLRGAIGMAYTHYAELEEKRAAARRMTDLAARAFAGHPLLEPHRSSPGDEMADVFEWQGHHILEASRFLVEESRSQRLELATWQGPLVAALIGGGAGALVALLLGG